MRTEIKKISELTPEEYKYCYNANLDSTLGMSGRMRESLVFYRLEPESANEDEVRVVLLWDDEKVGARKLVGWSMSLIEQGNKVAWFWVKPHHRNKGYGTVLMKEIKKNINPKPKVFPWSEESGAFFSKFDTAVNERNVWLVNKPKVC